MGSTGIFSPILGTFGAIRKTSRSIPEYISVGLVAEVGSTALPRMNSMRECLASTEWMPRFK
jgi:hypothetical protein